MEYGNDCFTEEDFGTRISSRLFCFYLDDENVCGPTDCSPDSNCLKDVSEPPKEKKRKKKKKKAMTKKKKMKMKSKGKRAMAMKKKKKAAKNVKMSPEKPSKSTGKNTRVLRHRA